MKMSNEIIMGVNFRKGKAKEGISSLCTAELDFCIEMSSDFDFIKSLSSCSEGVVLFAQMTREQGNLGEDDLRMEIINEGFCFIYG